MLGNELGTVIASDMLWRAMLNKEICQQVEYIRGSYPTCYVTCQCLVCILIDDISDLNLRPSLV